MRPDRWDPTSGSIDRDIREHLDETMAGEPTSRRHIEGLNLQAARNRGEVVLGVEQPRRVGLIKDLLSSDGQPRPGDENLTGLGAALAGVDRELRHIVAAGLYERALERLDIADHADESPYLPPDLFRERAWDAAEQAARLWREVIRA